MNKMIRINLDLGGQMLTFTGYEQKVLAFLDQLSWQIANIRHQITTMAKVKQGGGDSDDSGAE